MYNSKRLVWVLWYSLFVISPPTLSASFLWLAIRMHMFRRNIKWSFSSCKNFFLFICLLFVKGEGSITHLPCFYDIAFSNIFVSQRRYINRIESRVHMVTKGEEPIHVGNRSATVNYGASLFTAWAKLLILIVASEKLPVVAIILVFMYFRFSFADWHSVISSLNTTYGTIVAVNWRKFQIAHFTKPDCFRTLSLIDGLCCYPLLRLGAVP